MTAKRSLGLAIAISACAFLAFLGTATARWNVVQSGNLILKTEAKISPSALPRHEYAPISFGARGEIATADGTHPPATREAVIYVDRNIEADAYGLPTCSAGQLEARTVKMAREVCGKATIGSGVGTAEIAFPEQAPILVKSPLTAFNGGVKGDTTTVFVHAYTTVPSPTSIISTMKFQQTGGGRYGVRGILKIPKIAGGAGSVTGFDFKVERRYDYRGFAKSYILGQCPDGQLSIKGTVLFRDEVGGGGDSTNAVALSLPCAPKG